MTRLFGDTIAVRLLMLVAACVALTLGLTCLVVELGLVTTERDVHQMANRIAGVALAIEAVPPAQRAAVAAHASEPGFKLLWVAGMSPPVVEPPQRSMLLPALAQARHVPAESLRILQPAPGELAIPLADDTFLLVIPAASLSFTEPAFGALPLAVLCGSALVLCLLVARRSARGIARFAKAAEQFGRAGTTQPLPVTGPREVRAGIVAFNAMLARVEQVMAERTAMLGALSHDLRTPLARLRLRAEFMADPREQARMLRDVDEMSAMVNQSLEFLRDDSRTEAATRLDLAVLLQGIAEEQADLGHAVTFHGPEHATVQGRPLSLKRALGNVVENAVKYGTRADIELRVEDRVARITISDDGPGIPERLRDLVFEPFYRAEASRNKETGGVGLGLSIARAVVRTHGGEIRLSDHALGGLAVHIGLPVDDRAMAQPASASMVSRSGAPAKNFIRAAPNTA